MWLFQWTNALKFSIQAPSNSFYKTLGSMLFRTSFPWLCSEIKLFLTKPAVDALRKLEVAAAVLVCGWSISYGSWCGTCTCAGCFTTKAPMQLLHHILLRSAERITDAARNNNYGSVCYSSAQFFWPIYQASTYVQPESATSIFPILVLDSYTIATVSSFLKHKKY